MFDENPGHWNINGYKISFEVESHGADKKPVVAIYRTVSGDEYKGIKNNTFKIDESISMEKGFSFSYKGTQTENIYNLANGGALAQLYKNPVVLKVLVDIAFFKDLLSRPDLKSEEDTGMSLSYFLDPKKPTMDTYVAVDFLQKIQKKESTPVLDKTIDGINFNIGSLSLLNKNILAIIPFTPK